MAIELGPNTRPPTSGRRRGRPSWRTGALCAALRFRRAGALCAALRFRRAGALCAALRFQRTGALCAVVAGLGLMSLPGLARSDPPRAASAVPQRARDNADTPVATFIGLRQLGGSRTLIYVELTHPVEPKLVQKGRTLEYLLPKTRVTLRNNQRPLLARHFDSVVHSAQLVPTKKDSKLVIQLREDVEPKSRLVRHAQGATFEVELKRPPKKE